MNRILNWIVISSENPEKVSATVKGVLLTWVAMALFVSQFFGLNFSEAKASYIVQDVSALAGATFMVLGLVRKLYNTFKKKPFIKEPIVVDLG